MWCHWQKHWHDMMPLALVSASCNVDSFVNGITAFLKSIWSKWGVIWIFGHVIPLALKLVSDDGNGVTNGTISFLRSGWSKWDVTWLLVMQSHWCLCQCHMVMELVSCDADGTFNGLDLFLSLRLTMRCNMTFGHVMPMASVSHDADSVVNAKVAFLMFRRSIQVATWHFG